MVTAPDILCMFMLISQRVPCGTDGLRKATLPSDLWAGRASGQPLHCVLSTALIRKVSHDCLPLQIVRLWKLGFCLFWSLLYPTYLVAHSSHFIKFCWLTMNKWMTNEKISVLEIKELAFLSGGLDQFPDKQATIQAPIFYLTTFLGCPVK